LTLVSLVSLLSRDLSLFSRESHLCILTLINTKTVPRATQLPKLESLPDEVPIAEGQVEAVVDQQFIDREAGYKYDMSLDDETSADTTQSSKKDQKKGGNKKDSNKKDKKKR
jgi:hypothetical protein